MQYLSVSAAGNHTQVMEGSVAIRERFVSSAEEFNETKVEVKL